MGKIESTKFEKLTFFSFSDESKTEKELHRKMLITGLIGGLTLITLLSYRIAKHIWRI